MLECPTLAARQDLNVLHSDIDQKRKEKLGLQTRCFSKPQKG